jgi:hypothetical protein
MIANLTQSSKRSPQQIYGDPSIDPELDTIEPVKIMTSIGLTALMALEFALEFALEESLN